MSKAGANVSEKIQEDEKGIAQRVSGSGRGSSGSAKKLINQGVTATDIKVLDPRVSGSAKYSAKDSIKDRVPQVVIETAKNLSIESGKDKKAVTESSDDDLKRKIYINKEAKSPVELKNSIANNKILPENSLAHNKILLPEKKIPQVAEKEIGKKSALSKSYDDYLKRKNTLKKEAKSPLKLKDSIDNISSNKKIPTKVTGSAKDLSKKVMMII